MTALKVEDNWLIVSSSYEEIRIGDRYVFQTVNPIGYFLSQYLDNEEHEVSLGNLKAKKVIATSKKIGELPLVDVPDEWDSNDAKMAATENYNLESKTEKAWAKHFKAGFNKAKEKYQFTLEDMKNAHVNGYLLADSDDIDLEKEFDKYLQRFTKPKQYQVEIEMELKRNLQEDGFWEDYYAPKITEGKVKILNWKEL